jgi:DNA polymerase-3 subunit epsilon
MTKTKPRRIVFDIESTGPDPQYDRIIEVAFVDYHDPTNKEIFRIKPAIPISPDAQNVHGISIEDLHDAPPLSEVIGDLRNWIEDAELVGYNIRRFDWPIIKTEFKRCQVEIAEPRLIDPYVIYVRQESRTLTDAYKFFCDQDLEGAHGALADTEATLHVTKAMLEKYMIQDDIDVLEDASSFPPRAGALDRAGRLLKGPEGDAIYGFGRYKGKKCQDHEDYLHWIINGDFPADTKKVCHDILEGLIS